MACASAMPVSPNLFSQHDRIAGALLRQRGYQPGRMGHYEDLRLSGRARNEPSEGWQQIWMQTGLRVGSIAAGPQAPV